MNNSENPIILPFKGRLTGELGPHIAESTIKKPKYVWRATARRLRSMYLDADRYSIVIAVCDTYTEIFIVQKYDNGRYTKEGFNSLVRHYKKKGMGVRFIVSKPQSEFDSEGKLENDLD
jgi:hypothetical protein